MSNEHDKDEASRTFFSMMAMIQSGEANLAVAVMRGMDPVTVMRATLFGAAFASELLTLHLGDAGAATAVRDHLLELA